MEIKYAVSPIGLGHASRSVAIALELREYGYKVNFHTGGLAVNFLSSYGFNVNRFHDRIPYFKVSKDGKLKGITWWMISYIRFYKRMKKKAERLFAREKPSFVIADEEFAFANIAIENKIPTIFVSDLITTSFAQNWIAEQIEKRTNKWFTEFYERCPLTIVPEEEGPIIGNMVYVGPIVRKLTDNPDVIREKLGVEETLILATSGGSPIGPYIFSAVYNFLKRNSSKGIKAVFVGVGAKKFKIEDKIIAFEVYRDLQNLVAASDLVITSAGKSTIDECRVYGRNCIAIPIKGHFEQERNAQKIGFRYEDIHRIHELIKDYLEKPSPKPIENNLGKAVEIIRRFIREHGK
ncbi:MAG: glycosyltransferase [Candidatus Njordarchaeia archaeon]